MSKSQFIILLSCDNFRQLGYGNAVRETPGSLFGTADETVQVLLDEVGCTGNEYYLSDCPHLGWGTHDCRHHEDAGVVCQGPQGPGKLKKSFLVVLHCQPQICEKKITGKKFFCTKVNLT